MKTNINAIFVALSLCLFSLSCEKDPYLWSDDVTEEQKMAIRQIYESMVSVEEGTFWMGAQTSNVNGQNYDIDALERESPVHQVTLSRYSIGKYEVTQEQWQAIMGTNPSHFTGDSLPVEDVSWDDIQVFINNLNNLSGLEFRLPTEAEWEYAARGGNKSKGYKYSGSNSISAVAWYSDNSFEKTHSVGTKLPNELGIYDMSGNVVEWCQDRYSNYSSSPQTNPQGSSSGLDRVLRCSSWNTEASNCRVSYRSYDNPGIRDVTIGFRLVLVK